MGEPGQNNDYGSDRLVDSSHQDPRGSRGVKYIGENQVAGEMDRDGISQCAAYASIVGRGMEGPLVPGSMRLSPLKFPIDSEDVTIVSSLPPSDASFLRLH